MSDSDSDRDRAGTKKAREPAAKVVRVDVRRRELTAKNVPELRELFGLERLPLANSTVAIELEGVPTAVVNALRRTAIDEMPGRCLYVPSAADATSAADAGGFDEAASTDPFMLPQFVNQRIALIPLRPQVAEETVERLRLRLDVANRGTAVMPFYAGDLVVEAGRLGAPLFNPTFRLGFLQPGKRVVIRGIRIREGLGRDDGAFLVARRGAHRHLDLPQLPERDTHERDGAAADLSGYGVSCFVADPRRHLLTAVVPATGPDRGEAVAVFADACAVIQSRLRRVAAAIRRDAAADSRGILFTVVPLEAGLEEGALVVPGETATIGVLLCRAVYELYPGVANVAHQLVDHENQLTVSVRHVGDVAAVFRDAIAHCVAVFESLRRGMV